MILLDTHVLIWAVAEPKKLSRAATAAIMKARADDGVAIAAVSLWEIAILVARRRIQAYGSVEASVRMLTQGVAILPLTPDIAALATQFPEEYSRDPADRQIAATARAAGLPLITRDEKIRASGFVKTVW